MTATLQKKNKRWYDELAEELQRRDHRCGLLGRDEEYYTPYDVFQRYNPKGKYMREYSEQARKRGEPIKGPLEKFRADNPFSNQDARRNAAVCKTPIFDMWRTVLNKMDRQRRYYRNVRSQRQCNAQRYGRWDPAATNRSNRVSKGVCWTGAADKKCGRAVSGDVLRGDISTTRAEADCNADAECVWQSERRDCYSKQTLERLRPVVKDPPADMPADAHSGLERYLHEWYQPKGEAKHGPAPMTTALLGEGNRCVAPSSTKSASAKSGHGSARESASLDFDEEEAALASQPKPSIVQSVINMVMKNVARHPDTPMRGMLAWHSTGSGKTCTAAGVMDAFWDEDVVRPLADGRQVRLRRDIVFASSLDALSSNPDYKFHECALRVYPRFADAVAGAGKAPNGFDCKPSSEAMWTKGCNTVGAMFAQRGVRFYSFAKLANRVEKTEKWKKQGIYPLWYRDAIVGGGAVGGGGRKAPPPKRRAKDVVEEDEEEDEEEDDAVDFVLPRKGQRQAAAKRGSVTFESIPADMWIDLDNTVLVIDEVHNLFRPLPAQKKQHALLEKELVDPRRHPGLKVVILSATPGDTIDDAIKLLNIVRPNNMDKPIQPPNPDDAADVERFKRQIRGLVSYFDMSGDRTRFPEVDNRAPVKYPMSAEQFARYVEAYRQVTDAQKDFGKLAKDNQTNKYWAKARRYANSLYDFVDKTAVGEYSAKMPALLQAIQDRPSEKHYVYSAFYDNKNRGYGSQGILAIANFLEKAGYKKLTVAEAKRVNAQREKGVPLSELLPPGTKRYILATQKEITGKTAAAKTAKAQQAAGKNLHEMISVYNAAENARGAFVHVMLASQGFNEGIDLRAVRNIHIFEPLVTMASDKQTIGRAARFCSHSDLDMDAGEWKVVVHRYMVGLPGDKDAHAVDIVASPKQRSAAAPADVDPVAQARQRLGDVEAELADIASAKDALKAAKAERTAAKRAKDVVGLAAAEASVARLEAQVAQGVEQAKVLRKEATALRKQVKQGDAGAVATAKKRRKAGVVDSGQVDNIEEKVYREAQERARAMFVLFQAMREAAVDCRLLSAFHAQTAEPVKCAVFEDEAALISREKDAAKKLADAKARAAAEERDKQRREERERRERELAEEEAAQLAARRAREAEQKRRQAAERGAEEAKERDQRAKDAFMAQRRQEEEAERLAQRERARLRQAQQAAERAAKRQAMLEEEARRDLEQGRRAVALHPNERRKLQIAARQRAKAMYARPFAQKRG